MRSGGGSCTQRDHPVTGMAALPELSAEGCAAGEVGLWNVYVRYRCERDVGGDIANNKVHLRADDDLDPKQCKVWRCNWLHLYNTTMSVSTLKAVVVMPAANQTDPSLRYTKCGSSVANAPGTFMPSLPLPEIPASLIGGKWYGLSSCGMQIA